MGFIINKVLQSFNIELRNLQEFYFEITNIESRVKKKDIDLKILFFDNKSHVIPPHSNPKICQVIIDVISRTVKTIFFAFLYFISSDRATPRQYPDFI